MRKSPVDTTTAKGKPIKRFFYIDISKSLEPENDLEECILSIPEEKKLTSDFGKKVDLDLSTKDLEFELLYFPLNSVFSSDDWLLGYSQYWAGKPENLERLSQFSSFRDKVLESFKAFQLPVITLSKQTSKEAVCLVFEKVNTGGKPLDAFELVTAMYASDGFHLRDDWFGNKTGNEGFESQLKSYLSPPDEKFGVLKDIQATDLLQVVSLLYTRQLRLEAEKQGKSGKELPQVTAKREALLDVPLGAYKQYREIAVEGFKNAAKFLRALGVYRVKDLPYQTQVTALAAIFTDIQQEKLPSEQLHKLKKWYWCGVFGELYGSSTDTRISKDFLEVSSWLSGLGPEPTTVFDSQFRPERLTTMRMRLSAAYKGVNLLLMGKNAQDWLTSIDYAETSFFAEAVDIHHVFPQKWCEANAIPKKIYDSVINKSPLSARTNRVIGGNAPSKYLVAIQKGSSKEVAVTEADLRKYVESHFVDYSLLVSDNFKDFYEARKNSLIQLISEATGKEIIQQPDLGEEDFEIFEEDVED